MARLQKGKFKRPLEELRIIPWWAYAVAALLLAVLGWAFGGWCIGKLERTWANTQA